MPDQHSHGRHHDDERWQDLQRAAAVEGEHVDGPAALVFAQQQGRDDEATEDKEALHAGPHNLRQEHLDAILGHQCRLDDGVRIEDHQEQAGAQRIEAVKTVQVPAACRLGGT